MSRSTRSPDRSEPAAIWGSGFPSLNMKDVTVVYGRPITDQRGDIETDELDALIDALSREERP